MGNKGLLAVITVVLIGIFTVLVIQMNEETPAQKISDSVSETIDDVEDKFSDAAIN